MRNGIALCIRSATGGDGDSEVDGRKGEGRNKEKEMVGLNKMADGRREFCTIAV
jgi:hypothetical protein